MSIRRIEFHGNLALGNKSIVENLEGFIDESEDQYGMRSHSGQFEAPGDALIKAGEEYRLNLDDGKSAVILTSRVSGGSGQPRIVLFTLQEELK